ncbi:unnamed protein product [Bursaphelenchus okinawaensis]|uniref:Uncharacterized protein n=1 Tax=Bursaphelenchus okinawaensis TaxID=465554 RepID=A0A811KSF9_9BILA|nr:unnamed protein product [Bursaphelenchus okinawaensis]CAG9111222.1 unnamed protein product [Bursaphelenchus okinawaensis]
MDNDDNPPAEYKPSETIPNLPNYRLYLGEPETKEGYGRVISRLDQPDPVKIDEEDEIVGGPKAKIEDMPKAEYLEKLSVQTGVAQSQTSFSNVHTEEAKSEYTAHDSESWENVKTALENAELVDIYNGMSPAEYLETLNATTARCSSYSNLNAEGGELKADGGGLQAQYGGMQAQYYAGVNAQYDVDVQAQFSAGLEAQSGGIGANEGGYQPSDDDPKTGRAAGPAESASKASLDSSKSTAYEKMTPAEYIEQLNVQTAAEKNSLTNVHTGEEHSQPISPAEDSNSQNDMDRKGCDLTQVEGEEGLKTGIEKSLRELEAGGRASGLRTGRSASNVNLRTGRSAETSASGTHAGTFGANLRTGREASASGTDLRTGRERILSNLRTGRATDEDVKTGVYGEDEITRREDLNPEEYCERLSVQTATEQNSQADVCTGEEHSQPISPAKDSNSQAGLDHEGHMAQVGDESLKTGLEKSLRGLTSGGGAANLRTGRSAEASASGTKGGLSGASLRTGREASLSGTNLRTGRERSVSNLRTGRSASNANLRTGRQRSQSKLRTGRERSASNLCTGRQRSLSNLRTGRATDEDVKTGVYGEDEITRREEMTPEEYRERLSMQTVAEKSEHDLQAGAGQANVNANSNVPSHLDQVIADHLGINAQDLATARGANSQDNLKTGLLANDEIRASQADVRTGRSSSNLGTDQAASQADARAGAQYVEASQNLKATMLGSDEITKRDDLTPEEYRERLSVQTAAEKSENDLGGGLGAGQANVSTGRSASNANLRTGRTASNANLRTGRNSEASTSGTQGGISGVNLRTGREASASGSNVCTGRERSASNLRTGRSASSANLRTGRQKSLSNLRTGRDRSASNLRTGRAADEDVKTGVYGKDEITRREEMTPEEYRERLSMQTAAEKSEHNIGTGASNLSTGQAASQADVRAGAQYVEASQKLKTAMLGSDEITKREDLTPEEYRERLSVQTAAEKSEHDFGVGGLNLSAGRGASQSDVRTGRSASNANLRLAPQAQNLGSSGNDVLAALEGVNLQDQQSIRTGRSALRANLNTGKSASRTNVNTGKLSSSTNVITGKSASSIDVQNQPTDVSTAKPGNFLTDAARAQSREALKTALLSELDDITIAEDLTPAEYIERLGIQTGVENSAHNLRTGRGASQVDVRTGRSASRGNLRTGREASASGTSLRTGRQRSQSNLRTGLEQSLSDLSTGRSASTASLSTGRQRSQSNLRTGRDQSASNLRTGRDHSASNLRTGRSASSNNLRTGRERSLSNLQLRTGRAIDEDVITAIYGEDEITRREDLTADEYRGRLSMQTAAEKTEHDLLGLNLTTLTAREYDSTEDLKTATKQTYANSDPTLAELAQHS